MNITAQLADWTCHSPRVNTSLAMERATDAVQDTVACMVAGAGDAGARALRDTATSFGDGPASVVGATIGAAPPWAALANGMAAHALDFDDNYLPALTHASAVLVPALLALAESRDLDGAALLDAYITGLELHAVLGRGAGRYQYDLGWHSTATIGCIGTAGACARLLRLDAVRTRHALSLGVSQASGAKVQFGSPAKPFHAGMAAHNAVLAALLAESGLEARADAIEGERGFLDLYARPRPGSTIDAGAGAGDPGEDARWSTLIASLGERPAIEVYGLAPKLYPCCGSAHRILDGVLALRETHRFTAAQIESIHARIGYGNRRNLCYDDPGQEMEARFSLPYCVAVAVDRGRLTLADFTAEAVHRPHIRAFLPRVTVSATEPGAEGEDPTGRLPHTVTVTLHGGRSFEASVARARGTADNPFSERDKRAKFEDCCTGFLDEDAFAIALQACRNIATERSVRPLMRALRYEAGGDRGERFEARTRNVSPAPA